MSETAFATLQRWEYRDTSAPPPSAPAKSTRPAAPVQPVGLTEEQVQLRVRAALAEAEQRWAAETEVREAQRAAQLHSALEAFATEQARYFRVAEREVVQLALAVARKILEREAVLDPDLLAAMVRIALDRVTAGSAVRMRVPPTELARWRQQNIAAGKGYTLEIAADASLLPGDCWLETDVGSASLGFDVQLKNIERGMLDLLGASPVERNRPSTETKAGDGTDLRER